MAKKKTTKKKSTKKRTTKKKSSSKAVESHVVEYVPPEGLSTQSAHGCDLRAWAAVDSFLPAMFEDPSLALVSGKGPSPDQRSALRPKPKRFWEREELVLFCFRALQLRFRKRQIRQGLAEFIAYMGYDPHIENLQFLDVLGKARKLLREEIELDAEDHVANGYETMIQVLQDPNSMPADKIKAQQVINELLGIGARYNTEKSSAESTVEEIQRLLGNDVA